MKQIQLIALLLAAAGLTACSSDEGTGTVEAPRLIIVDVTENPFTESSPLAKKRVATRTAECATTESFDKFSMNYTQDYKYDFYKTSGSWTNTNTWPNGTNKCDFYAYTDDMGNTEQSEAPERIFQYNGGNPYIAFTVHEDAFSQHDLLVAKQKNVSYSNSNSDVYGHVSLSFDHALAAVLFQVKITNKLREKVGNTLTVNSIVLRNVSKSGKYYYDKENDKEKWDTGGSGFADYTLTNGNFYVITDYQEVPCKYLFLIPQKRDANGTTGTYIEVTYTFSGQTQSSAVIPFDVDWEAGSLYPIDIVLGTATIK